MNIPAISATSAIKTTIPLPVQNLAAAVLGLIILLAVGFSPMNAAHNAAHDTRHTLAFPCH